MEGFVINNNSTAVPRSEEPQIDLKIEVYNIMYDWGVASMGSPDFKEFAEPHYIGTLDNQFTSANFSIDSTSDMRYSGSFSVILDYDSDFIVHASDHLFWQNVWLKVIKTYDYPNGNKETKNTQDKHIIGWFVPNSGSYNYNASSRELSLSCTDLLSFLTDSRGGHLTNWEESLSGLKYMFYEMVKTGINTETFIKDNVYKAARCASGLVLEGEKNISIEEKQYDNFLTKYNVNNVESSEFEKTNAAWKEDYKNYKSEHKSNSDDGKTEKETEPWRIKFYYLDKNGEWSNNFYDDSNSMVVSLVSGYAQIIPIASVLVNLQNGHKLLPYDLEFNGDTTLYDVLKKITDLYPRQSVYFDANRRLNVVQYALSWGGNWRNSIAARRADFLGLTLEEQWSINLESIKNYTVVWGRNQTCMGYYGMTSLKGICPKCGQFHEFYISPTGEDGYLNTCVLCGTPLQRLNMNDEVFSTQRIGTHKQVVYNDNLLTDEECFNEAKALTIANCHAKKTLSVTLFDRYLPLYDSSYEGSNKSIAIWGSDTGVGRLIEYTSELTGETDLYTLLKWSNDFNSGTVTLELEPFYPCINTIDVLPIPTFNFNIDSSGLLTMTIWGQGELFKVYCSKSSLLPDSEGDMWNWSTLDLNFIGETYSETFTYQFTESGTYSISCQAWSSTIFPSPLADYKVFTVEINEDIRVDINTGETTTEINGSSVGVGINYLVTNEDEYITDSNGNKFIY